MKSSLSGVDVRFLVRELSGLLAGGRFDKAYSLEGNGLRLRFHLSGAGSRDLVVFPGFACVSSFQYPQLERPYSFAMSLRKHLEGLRLLSVGQHGLDRILELWLEGSRGRFLLVVELFSRGNAVLCDSDMRIVAVRERQEWKDRMVLPGSMYAYPPGADNPFSLGDEDFKGVLLRSGKGVAASIASMGLGGFYAEEICLKAGIDKIKPAASLSGEELQDLYESFSRLARRVDGGIVKPSIVLDGKGGYADVVPLEFASYAGRAGKAFGSFNEAVDEYFSKQQSAGLNAGSDKEYLEALRKLRVMEEKQQEALVRLQSESEERRKAGDAVYGHLAEIDAVLEQVRRARKQNLEDDEITSRFTEGAKRGVAEAKLFKKLEGNLLTLELD
ncbi:MAG: NFACT family protein [Candidatus Altiarchaeota archaeon]|nr:NFACT family protein [Candidatus Altiarchaeota archaeon]